MKYCKKCGMLLEDNMEICIGCGSDVTQKGSFSKYPEPMQEKIDMEKKEESKRNLAILAIILIFVVILLLVGIFVAQMYINGIGEDGEEGSGKSFFAQRLKDSIDNDNSKASSNAKPEKKREVKDDQGVYYKYTSVQDDEGHEIFRAVYPEDLGTVEHSIEDSRESRCYPAVFSFVATNDDNTAQLTFTSPQHYQYITMQGGDLSPADIESALDGQVSFYDFTDVETYMQEIIKQAYPTARKIDEVEETDAVSSVSEELDNIIKSYEDGAEEGLAKLFGLPDTTKFKHNSTYKSDKIMNYRILTKEDHAVSCKFYVPVFCVRYDYEDEESELSGQLSDCYILAVTSFEAGSDELYDTYGDTFELFVNNIKLTDDFFSLNDCRLNKDIETFLNSAPLSAKTFASGEYVINSGKNVEQVFIAPEKELVFATPSMDEYPGDDYLQLEVR
ncbi:MAG: hypothetical protein IKP31_02745 [Lachnospiraceae bacterium]|nr:hypothetical protein [Lachnospiraceae bacterium]